MGCATAETVEAGQPKTANGATDTMEALEASAPQQPSTRVPGFVSAGIVQPDEGTQGQQQDTSAGMDLSQWSAL